MQKTGILILGLIYMACLFGCGKKDPAVLPTGTGSILFTANGEDFVRQGFIDKQGWHISFKTLYVNIVDPIAYGSPGEAFLKGSFLMNLSEGDKNAAPIHVGKLDDIKAGNYQSLKFKIRKMTAGEYKGYSIVMIGTAERDKIKVPFVIKLDEEMDYDGKEGYVGDEIKGMLAADGTTEVEMTFHFDHLFGDKDAKPDSHVNTDSVGFDFFNRYAKNGKVEVSQNDLKAAPDFNILCKGLWTLGHLGEGHCVCSNQSSAQK